MSRTWSKIKNSNHICKEKIVEEYPVKIYKIDPYFSEPYRKKKKNWWSEWSEYILFRIDICFTEYFLAIEIDEKSHTDRDLIFEETR